MFSWSIVAYELLHRQCILVSVLQQVASEGFARKEAAVREYAAVSGAVLSYSLLSTHRWPLVS